MSDNAQIDSLVNEGTLVKDSTVEAKKVAMRDMYNIKVNQTVKDADPEFGELTETALQPDFLPPIFSEQALAMLRQNNVLVIHSQPGFDTDEFGLYLAGKLVDGQDSLKAFELQQNIENVEVSALLRKRPENQVVVCHRLHPQHVRHDLAKFVSQVARAQQYVVITTDVQAAGWAIGAHLKQSIWFDVPPQGWYSKAQLVEMLVDALNEQLEEIDNLQDGFSVNDLLAGVPLTEVAETLALPVKLQLFARYYLEHSDQLTASTLRSLVQRINKQGQDLVGQWFQNLNHEQRVIALGACLLEGLFDDQFFEALKQLAKSGFWEKSLPKLQAIDYYQLEFLTPFFRFEETRNGKRLHSRYPHLRTQLISAVWESHRRHVLAAIDPLKEMAVRSLHRDEKNWALYGTPERRAVCRESFEGAIADLGTVALTAVEPLLLELAASGNFFVQSMAARAISQWRESGHDELLFGTLTKWQFDDVVVDRIATFLAKRENVLNDAGLNQDAPAFIKATAVLALGYAASFDRPNQLHDSIVASLCEFAQDPDQQVRERIYKALPRILAKHPLRLKNEVMDRLMIHEDYSEAIALGLALAHEDFPEEIAESIRQWFDIATQSSSEANRRQKLTKRDNVVATLLLLLQAIGFGDNKQGAISLEEAHKWILTLLKQEKRRRLRTHILGFAAYLVQHDFDVALTKLDPLMTTLSHRDLRSFLQALGDLFLDQRQKLADAPYTIKIGEQEFPAWLPRHGRPLTHVEQGLLGWLSSNSLSAKKIATLAFLEIARLFEVEEYAASLNLSKQLEARKQLQSSSAKPAPTVTNAAPAAPLGLGLFLRIRIFVYLLFRPAEERETLKSILRTLLYQRQFKRNHIQLVAQKWRARSKGFPVKLGGWLQQFYS